MIDHRTAVAKKVYKFKTDAENADLVIQFADSLALERNGGPYGLDSLDLGDALGEFIEQLEIQNGGIGDLMLISPAGFTVTISADWELFQWGIELPEMPFDNLRPFPENDGG